MTEGFVFVRDSKNRDEGMQKYSIQEWRPLVNAIEGGKFRV